jgi:hypothetical protein
LIGKDCPRTRFEGKFGYKRKAAPVAIILHQQMVMDTFFGVHDFVQMHRSRLSCISTRAGLLPGMSKWSLVQRDDKDPRGSKLNPRLAAGLPHLRDSLPTMMMPRVAFVVSRDHRATGVLLQGGGDSTFWLVQYFSFVETVQLLRSVYHHVEDCGCLPSSHAIGCCRISESACMRAASAGVLAEPAV